MGANKDYETRISILPVQLKITAHSSTVTKQVVNSLAPGVSHINDADDEYVLSLFAPLSLLSAMSTSSPA